MNVKPYVISESELHNSYWCVHVLVLTNTRSLTDLSLIANRKMKY